MNPIAAILATEPFVVLDGGLASELEARGHDLDDPLWSARVLRDDPDAIARVHRDYFAAGADVATTASYQTALPDLLRRSIELARAEAQRVAAHDRPTPLVVASLGSYGATLPGAAEYTGVLGRIDDDQLAAFHRQRLAVVREGADLVAFETIPSLREARAIARVLAEAAPGVFAWVSFTCADALHTGSGDALRECAAAIADAPGLVAIGINCSAPAIVEPALALLARTTALPLVAYPNAGETWAGGHYCGARIEPEAFAALARRWWSAGARLVGGCCRTTPAHVAAIARLRAGPSGR